MPYCALFAILGLLALPRSEAKVVNGFLRTGENWIFLSRFCFLSLHGQFHYEVEYEDSFATQNIDLYYDTPEQWARVYGSKSDLRSCREKESVLQVNIYFEYYIVQVLNHIIIIMQVENNQFVNLTTDMAVAGCSRYVRNHTGKGYIKCKGTRNFNTARERWWFVAVSNCNSSTGLQLS